MDTIAIALNFIAYFLTVSGVPDAGYYCACLLQYPLLHQPKLTFMMFVLLLLLEILHNLP